MQNKSSSCNLNLKSQKSLIREVIEELGHTRIILPKFHCGLNFFEYFWGGVKRYPQNYCDYTSPTLQENMPIPLEILESHQPIWPDVIYIPYIDIFKIIWHTGISSSGSADGVHMQLDYAAARFSHPNQRHDKHLF